MTRKTNARVAGFTFLFYIAVGIIGMLISPGPFGDDTAARLASIAQHAPQMRIDMLLGLLTGFVAIVLGVALYGITRDEDHELAVLALACRVAEGVLVIIPILATLGLLSLATAAQDIPDSTSGFALAELLLNLKRWNVAITATFFAVGSTIFSWLMLRGRMIPVGLAWLGVAASVLLVIALPLRLAGILDGLVTQLIWIPMAAFEIPLGVWLLIKGAAMPSRSAAS